jgi:hypothetical protein
VPPKEQDDALTFSLGTPDFVAQAFVRSLECDEVSIDFGGTRTNRKKSCCSRALQSGSPQEAFQFEQAADGIPKELCSGVEDSAGMGINLELHFRQTDSVDDIVERVRDFGASIQDLDRRLYYLSVTRGLK